MLYPKLYAFLKRNPRLAKNLKKLKDQASIFQAGAAYASLLGKGFKLPIQGAVSSLEWYKKNAHHLPGLVFHPIDPPTLLQRNPPPDYGKRLYWKFADFLERPIRESFVIHIPQGMMYQDGFIISPDGYLLNDLSLVPDLEEDVHPVIARGLRGNPKKIRGKVLMLSKHGGRGYYHWMMEVLPRLDFFYRSGACLKDIDKVVVNSQMAPFQRETLEILGVPKKKIIQSDWHSFIQADELIVPSLPDYVNIGNCAFLRHEFIQNKQNPKKANKKIYISRAQAGHRRISNEAALRNMLEKRGFQTVQFEKMSIAHQVSLMHESKLVLGPHGAGLTNLVFCQPGTKVIELIHPKAVKRLFWTLSDLMHLSYQYFFAEGDLLPPGEDSYLNSEDLTIDINKLSQMLDQVQADT